MIPQRRVKEFSLSNSKNKLTEPLKTIIEIHVSKE